MMASLDPIKTGHKRSRVLIVDDSAVARSIIGELVGKESDLVVAGYAADAVQAMKAIKQGGIDVITLDIEMPDTDGLTLLRQIMASKPLPVLMVAGSNPRQAARTLQALADGAVHFIEKHRGDAQSFEHFAKKFMLALRATSQTKVAHSIHVKTNPCAAKAPLARFRQDYQIIAIGASTGGTEAIKVLLSQLPIDCPPVVVCIHMPLSFTSSYADRLDSQLEHDVQLLSDGEILRRGCVYVVPGDQQGGIVRTRSGQLLGLLRASSAAEIYRPSVDGLFTSIAHYKAIRCAAFILTGMGKDGTLGATALQANSTLNGTKIWCQSEETCVIFGMPKSALEAGAITACLPIQTITSGLFAEP